MVSTTVAFDRAARLLSTKATLRTVAGALLLAFGAWTAGNAVYHAVVHGGGHGAADHGHESAPAEDPHAGHDMSAHDSDGATSPAGQEPLPEQGSGSPHRH